MHASTKQLLSLRDSEPVAAEVQQHVVDCQPCQQQLQRLRNVRDSLRQLAQANLAQVNNAEQSKQQLDDSWNTIQQALQHRRQQRHRRYGQWGIAAAIFVAVIAAVPLLNPNPDNIDVADTKGAEPAPTAQQLQAQLIQRNAHLENALRELPQPPKVMRGGTAYAIASFEDQIAWVDYELSYGEQIGIDEKQSVDLLQNRAELLDSLYKLRYTQAMVSLASY